MNVSCPCLVQPLANAVMSTGFCAFSLPITINRPRSVLALPGGSDLLALERGTQSVVLLQDTDGDGVPDAMRTVASADSLNHGMAVHDGYLYASSDTTVYRWPWNGDSVTGSEEIVINNINADGNGGAPQGHKTRTLEFDDTGRLYVSVGSNNNVDPDSYRSRIRRFNIVTSSTSSSSMPSASPAPSDEATITTSAVPSFGPTGSAQPSSEPSLSSVPSASPAPSLEPSASLAPSAAPTPQVLPIDFMTGEVFADGIRNAVAMAFDRHGILWAADTGADNLYREDRGGDITNDNPAEELMRIPEEGLNFGYPYCWTEYRLDEPYAEGRGTAWAWPSFLYDGSNITDDVCRNVYAQADVAMQAHSTPLGITFYNYKPSEELPDHCTGGAFPESMDGYVFIAFHGSWNRDIPTGYKVVYVEMDADGNSVSEPIDLLAHIPPYAKWEDGFRPADVDFDECGRLLLSSDGTGGRGAKIVRIESIDPQCSESGSTKTENLSTGSGAFRRRWTAMLGLALLVSLGSML